MTETTKFEMASRGLAAYRELDLKFMEMSPPIAFIALSLARLYVSKQINKKELELLIIQATAQGHDPEKLKKE